MKKLLLVLIFFIIKLNAWELICRDHVSSTQTSYQYYYDLNTNTIKFQGLYNGQGTVSATSPNQYYFWYGFYNVKGYNGSQGYRSIANVKNQLKSDVTMLDAFYRLAPQVILNFYYNPNRANLNEHINYTDYELLYNSDGLAVESIVNDVWEGLYPESQKSSSGYLYDSGGTLIYYNGEKVSWIQSSIDKVLQHVKDNLYTLIRIIATPVGVCVSVVFALCLVFYVVKLGRISIKPIDDNIRKRGLNE